MKRFLPILALLLVGAGASAMEKVVLLRDEVGHVANESPLPNGGAARTAEEWAQLKPMLTDLSDAPIDFTKETLVYCSLPSAFDGGSYTVRAETIVLDGGALTVHCKAEWPNVFLEKTGTRRYHLAVIPKFDGPIEIAFSLIGPEFTAFAPLFATLHVPPLADYPIFGPAGTAAPAAPGPLGSDLISDVLGDKPASVTLGEDP